MKMKITKKVEDVNFDEVCAFAKTVMLMQGKHEPQLLVFYEDKAMPITIRGVEDPLGVIIKLLYEAVEQKAYRAVVIAELKSKNFAGQFLGVVDLVPDKSLSKVYQFANGQFFDMGKSKELEMLNPWVKK
jgi:hypothetical protein